MPLWFLAQSLHISWIVFDIVTNANDQTSADKIIHFLGGAWLQKSFWHCMSQNITKKIRTLRYQRCITLFNCLVFIKKKTIRFLSKTKSDLETINYRISQGSNQEPLMFLICINDTPNLINCDVRLFADDTCLFYLPRIQCYLNKWQMKYWNAFIHRQW